MASLEERVANLEAHTDKHAAAVGALRTDIADLRLELRTEIATLRGEMALRSETVELQRELAAVRAGMATRSDVADLRREMGTGMGSLRGELTHRIAVIEAKVDRLFVWGVGIMISGFVTVIGALVSISLRQ